MKFFAKMRWVASILLVFFIVLITNIIDRDNFNKLSYSVTTMYEDRIVAYDLIFEMSRIVKEKHIALLTSDTFFLATQSEQYEQQINQLLDRFKLTKLTKNEKSILIKLEEKFQSLWQSEKSSSYKLTDDLLKNINYIDQYLLDLSIIQLREGKRHVHVSNKAINTINLFTQGEIIFLILMAILIQIIILYKPKELNEL